ncbi:hypothetical protein ACOI8K_03735 [Bifidobacterium hominis]|uniref:hypothetical protein n=1 Tax=Bifidobacterium hominis TaxID=3133177 RepID=UPI003D0479BF
MSNEKGTLSIEEQGIDTISEEERKGTPASLFWPWFAPTSPCSPCRTVRGRLASAFHSGRPPP